MRTFTETRGDHVAERLEPSLGMTFDSLGESYDFYNLYSWERGFRIRYGKSKAERRADKNDAGNSLGCSGKPVKENTSSCHCECPAMIRLLRTDHFGWYITEQRVAHNTHGVCLNSLGKTYTWLEHTGLKKLTEINYISEMHEAT